MHNSRSIAVASVETMCIDRVRLEGAIVNLRNKKNDLILTEFNVLSLLDRKVTYVGDSFGLFELGLSLDCCGSCPKSHPR